MALIATFVPNQNPPCSAVTAHRPAASCDCLQLLLLGIVGQWLVKPALGMAIASTLVPALGLPTQVATGLVLVSVYAAALCSSAPTHSHVLVADAS